MLKDTTCTMMTSAVAGSRYPKHNDKKCKRMRYLDRWEALWSRLGVEENDEDVVEQQQQQQQHNQSTCIHPLGLLDLFGVSASTHPSHRLSCSPSQKEQSFYTLRLEHRVGGPMSRHVGEERILLFRSDRPGAIAKIIYSSTPPPSPPPSRSTTTAIATATATRSRFPVVAAANISRRELIPIVRTELSDQAQTKRDNNDYHDEEEYELSEMAQAKIHVLDVKEPYRGYDLGGLLFTEALQSLRRRYVDHPSLEDKYSEGSCSESEAAASEDVMVVSPPPFDGRGVIIDNHGRTPGTGFQPCSIRCLLDAEEDIRRHSKLVSFYQNLGCSVKPNAKILYLNNNDGETYRKVPMQIVLRADQELGRKSNNNYNMACGDGESLVTNQARFVPILLLDANSKNRIGLSQSNSQLQTPHAIAINDGCSNHNTNNRRNHGHSVDHHWLLMEDDQGRMQFRTTKGAYLVVSPHGLCQAISLSKWQPGYNGLSTMDLIAPTPCPCSYDNHPVQDSKDVFHPVDETTLRSAIEWWSKFQLFRVSDVCDSDKSTLKRASQEGEKQRMLRNSTDECLKDPLEMERMVELEQNDVFVSDESGNKELWLLRSVHGTFLGMDTKRHALHCSSTPAFWQVHRPTYSLTCTRDTPLRRHHYRLSWMYQSVDYVKSMHAKYRSFRLGTATLQQALDLVKPFTGYPFAVQRSAGIPNLRTRCFRTAEYFRQCGHPDWVQLLGLLYGMGSVVKCLDLETAIAAEEQFDWTIPIRSRVVGCAAPSSSITFGEFRSLNRDEYDSRYNHSNTGMYPTHCGLDHTLLTWSGPEYMYYMLQHNQVTIPMEGLRMLRLASLADWHVGHHYMQLTNDDDDDNNLDLQLLVTEFDEALHVARDEARQQVDLTDNECRRLWDMYYSGIATKYNVNQELEW